MLLSSDPAPTAPDLTPVPVLRALLSRASLVLWDFDGPVCGLFAGLRAPAIAAELRAMAAARLPHWTEADEPHDPLAVLRRTYAALPSDPEGVVSALRKRLEELETEAAATAEPTPGAIDLMEQLLAAGKQLVVATNNSEAAVRAYLELHGIAPYFGAVVGRHDDPRLMKPHPYCLERLLTETGTAAADGLMIGDSPADALAAASTGVPFVGYGTEAAKLVRLRDAGAEYFVADLEAMTVAAGA
ncbi:HAD family hydrolase [Streptomyces sp. NBC_00859]|uniref:HAD family hydrolase n=1 Tax=Streptomyces sp. NBC_00859 TaxID=2903682 RepID=UPI00386B464F|nr:HAD family hydrolase [Streptomyces sp. NBC_00859]